MAAVGWDDDDLFVDESIGVSGWNDDDDILASLDGSEVDDDAQIRAGSKAQSSVAAATTENNTTIEKQEASDGWGDDFEDFDDESLGLGTTEQNVTLVGSEVQGHSDAFVNPSLHTEIKSYVVSQLPYMASGLNAVLSMECNTFEKATALRDYYQHRPTLTDYTCGKELPRMTYTIIIPDTTSDTGSRSITNDADVHKNHESRQAEAQNFIAAYLRQEAEDEGSMHFLLPRCANQSLLADVLPALTGSDLLVRPQHHVSAVADRCHFVLDFVGPGSVTVYTQLLVSLPTCIASIDRLNNKWTVASVEMEISFAPNAPSIEYKIVAIHPMNAVPPVTGQVVDADQWMNEQVAGVVSMINELSPDLLDSNAMDNDESITVLTSGDIVNWDDIRDRFLQESSAIQRMGTGLQAAWKEVDNVARISDKLKALPSLLPNEDLINAVASAEVGYQNQPDPSVNRVQFPRPPSNENSAAAAPFAGERPKSVWGGLFSRIAQSVSLPEEDPDLYEEWRQDRPKNEHAGATSASPAPVASSALLVQKHSSLSQSPTPDLSPATALDRVAAGSPLPEQRTAAVLSTKPESGRLRNDARLVSDVSLPGKEAFPTLQSERGTIDEPNSTLQLYRRSPNSSQPSRCSLEEGGIPKVLSASFKEAVVDSVPSVCPPDGPDCNDKFCSADLAVAPDLSLSATMSNRNGASDAVLLAEPRFDTTQQRSSRESGGAPKTSTNETGATPWLDATPVPIVSSEEKQRMMTMYDPELDILPTRRRWNHRYPDLPRPTFDFVRERVE
jgi:hypothetical protein